jgi:hypothetical protein
MQVKFNDVFSGKASRRGKPQRQPVIQTGPVIWIHQPGAAYMAWRGIRYTAQLSQGPPRAWAGNPNDGDSRPAGRRRGREYGVGCHN